MSLSVSPFLTFNGQAKEAMNFYKDNLPNTTIKQLLTYKEANPASSEAEANLVMHGAITIGETDVLFLDMAPPHDAPAFNWANSLLIRCNTEEEFDNFHNALAKDGTVMMGPEAVGPIPKCSWVVDKFGVVWQPVLSFDRM